MCFRSVTFKENLQPHCNFVNFVEMALAELCGVPDFDTFSSENDGCKEIYDLSQNFTNNSHLGVPAFGNVSCYDDISNQRC